MPEPIPGHECSVRCGGGRHADLVYADAGADPGRIGQWFAWHHGVRVVSIEPAPEAPGFADAARLGLRIERLAATAAAWLRPADDVRVLVFWEATR